MFSERSLPSADEAANAVIASSLLNLTAAERAVEVLTPEDFLSATKLGERYATVFTAISSLVSRGKKPAAVLVASEMKRLGVKDESADELSRWLSEVSKSFTAGVSVDEYCNILRNYGYRRRLFMTGAKMRDLANNELLSLEDVVAQADALHNETMGKAESHDEPRTMGEVLSERMTEHRNRKPGEFIGLRTGFKDLDNMLRGMRGGDYIVIAARPSIGKTALAEEIAGTVATEGGKTRSVLFFSLEMPAEQLADRTIASFGGVNAGYLRGGLVEKSLLDNAESNLRRDGFYEAPYRIETRCYTVPQMRQMCNRIKRKYGLNLVVIDYLQLMHGHGKYGKSGNRVQEVGEISRSIKQLARELNVPFLVLSQLNRKLEDRKGEDRRPELSDLRETGDIEQDADVVTMLFRETPESTVTEVILRKNRNGPLGTVELGWIPERTKFTNLDKR